MAFLFLFCVGVLFSPGPAGSRQSVRGACSLDWLSLGCRCAPWALTVLDMEGGGEDEGYWETAYDESGNAYYYHTVTGETTWVNPYEPRTLYYVHAEGFSCLPLSGLSPGWARE